MAARTNSEQRQPKTAGMGRARRDLVAVGVLLPALALFAWSGVRVVLMAGGDDQRLVSVGVLLNIALILFSWRRYRDLATANDERTQVETRADQLAREDELTGFANRRALAELAATLLTQAARKGKAVALLVVDLDHFRTVNEVHGHLAGDMVLREAADIIRRALPPSAIAARLEGDEFAVMMPFELSLGHTVDTLADHIAGALAQPITARGLTVHIGASIGIARADGDGERIDSLLRRANIALHAAKAAGRGRHVWFDATMERELVKRNAIEAGVRAGIPLGEFVPYYEQQVDIATGQLIGFEVLARWEHPTQGTVPPDEFIPVAEECGLISDLSISVMRRAFEEARDWDPTITLSVNISPAQLKDPWLAQKIVKLLVETGYPPKRLEIEITETSLFQNLSLAQSIVGSLKNQGIRLALDDFGTGYSSLANLRALPFDRIKIDKSFVIAMNDDPESAAIVNAISKLGESLNLPVTAEGVEDEAIWNRLKLLGCHKGQGWHFAKPVPIAGARRMLADRGLLPFARGEPDPAAGARRAG